MYLIKRKKIGRLFIIVVGLLIICMIFYYIFYSNKIKTISYMQVEKKIEKKETFLFYVGRDTCEGCKIFYPILEEITKEKKLKNVKFYYLNAQSYQDAIKNKEENAQENWNKVKENLGFEFIPYLAYYENGSLFSVFKLEEIIYYGETKEDQERQLKYVKEKVEEWLNTVNVIENKEK